MKYNALCNKTGLKLITCKMIFTDDGIKFYQEKRKYHPDKQDVPEIFCHGRKRIHYVTATGKNFQCIKCASAISKAEVSKVNAVDEKNGNIDKEEYGFNQFLIESGVEKPERKKMQRNNRHVKNNQRADIETYSVNKCQQ